MAYKSNFTESVIDGSFYAPIKNVKKKQKNKNQSMIQQNNSIDSKSEINISKLNKVTDLYNNTKNNYEETITKLKKIDVPFSGNVYKSLPDNFEDAMKTISEKNKEIKTKALNSVNQITGNKTTLHKSSSGRTHGGSSRKLSSDGNVYDVNGNVTHRDGDILGGWLNLGAFEDGYQFGDITRTGLASINDMKQNVTTGALQIGEKTIDAGAWLLGKAGNVIGIDEAQENMQKFIERDLINEEGISKTLNKFDPIGMLNYTINGENTEENSILGQKTEALAQSGGQLGSTYLLSAAKIPWYLTTATTGFGGEVEEAFKQGATYDQAGISGAVSAGAEVLTEKMFGGISFGGKTLDEGAKRLIKNKVSNKMASTLLRYGLDATGEGIEEVVSEAISNVGRLSYQDKTLQEALFSEEAFDNYLDSLIGGIVLGGGMQSVNVYRSAKSGRDYDSGLTDNEQSVIDKEVENRKAEAEKEGKKLSKKDISKIEEEIKSDLQKGYISTDNIESVLGGDEYKQYKTILDKQNRYNELLDKKSGETSNREKLELEALTKELEGVNINTLKSNLENSMADKIANDDFLKASYNEKAKRSVKYNADLTKYDAKQQEVIKKAIDSGILNDTRKTHEFVDMVAKISADKGVSFDFANNQKLKDSGFAVEGKQVNGFVGENGITVNIDSNKALNRVVGHEIAHVLEGTDLGLELQKAIQDYATTKGEYDTKVADIKQTYEKIINDKITKEEKKLNRTLTEEERTKITDDIVNSELTADLVGDYLFTDADFVNNLSATKPNVFKKVYNEIKYLLKVATAGSKEARQLEKVKKVFEDAYRSNVTNIDADTKFSIQENDDGTKYVNIDIDQHIFDGKTVAEQNKIAKEYILNTFRENGLIADGKEIKVNNKTATKYTNPRENISDSKKRVKNRISTELDNLLNVSQLIKTEADQKNHSFAKDGWEYYLTTFKVNDNYFTGVANVGVNGDTRTLYDINQIKKMTHNDKAENTAAISIESSLYDNNISQNENIVNNSISKNSENDTKFSLSENYTEEQRQSIEKYASKYIGMSNEQLDREFTYANDSYQEMIKLSNDLQKQYKEYQKTDEFMNALKNYDFDSEAMKKADEYADKIRYYNREAEKYFAQRESINNILLGQETDTRSVKQIVKEAENHFGITKNFKETGYIDINGNQIDFSGAHEGGQKGSRSLDHRQINEIDTDMDTFIGIGNIRILPEGGGINLEIEPNSKQYSKLRDYIDYINDEIYVDINKSDGTYDSARYKKGTSASKIINDIKEYYKTGSFPKQSEFADFYYSLSRNNENLAPVRGDIYGSDIKLQVEEAIAPLKEDIAKLQESLQPITQLDETNLTTEADSNTENNEFRALTEEDLPMFEQQYKESPVENIAPIEREQTTDYMQDTISLDEKAIKSLVKSVISPLDLNRAKKIELESVIQEFSKNGDATKQDLFDTLQDRFGEINIENTLEDIKQVQETLRKTKVNVDRFIQNDIKDYFQLKQKNFGKIKFSKEGMGVDQVYQELSSEYPNLFPSDLITPSDQFLQMVDVANMDSVEVEKMYFDDEYLQDITDHIYDSVQDYKFKETLKLVEAQNRLPIDESLIPPEIVETPSNTEVVEDIAPINTESDTQVEEELPIKERNKLKLENYKTLLNSYQEQKVESYESFNKEIYAKTNQYADLTNKNTIKANTLKMQIENLKLRRDNAQIEYDRRIENTNNRIESMNSKEFKEKELAVTRKELQQAKIDAIKNKFHEQGYDFDEVLDNAKSKSTLSSVDNTPQRFVEKSLGYKEGQILNDLTSNQTALNESEGIKWLNSFTNRKEGQLAKISKEYNIKPFSKEDKAAQMYGEGFYVNDKKELVKYGDDELAKDFPDLKTQERIKGLAKDPRIRKIYDDTLTSINESRARNGYPEIPRRKDYFLHFRAMEDTFSKLGLPFNPNDIKAKDLPTDMAGMTTDLKPGQPYFASAKKRLGHDTTYSLLGGMEKYLNSAKNQIYHIDDIQTLRALRNYIAEKYGQAKGLENLDLMTPEEAEARIKEVYGSHLSNFAKFLNEQANVLAGKTSLIDRGLEGIIGRRGIQTLDTINSQVGKNMVGFSISSPFTNLISTVQAFAKSNKYDSIKAFAQLSSNKIKSIFGKSDGFAENDPTMIRRQGIDNFYRTPYQKVSDFGYLLMGGIDNFSSEFIIRAKYNELTRKGMDSEQAHIEAGKWASRILGDRSLGQQPQLYNSKMLGLFTKFQLEVRNQLDSMMYDTIQEANVDTETIQNQKLRNAKKAAKITSTMVQLAVFQHLFGKAFESVIGYNPAFDIVSVLIKAFGFDDDEESEDTVGDNLEQAFMELLGDLPYTSTLTGGRIPIESALPVEQLITGKDNYGNEKSRWETLQETLPYYVLPGGYNQAKKTYQGLSMFTDDKKVTGSYTDSGNLRFPVEATPQNVLQAALFGQYASSNARDYFDNERKPLKEKQIQEYADLDIPIADYWKYREGLTEQKTIQDKFDYIDSLDVTDEQKNIMINNAVTRKDEIDISNYDDFGSYEEFDFATKNEEKYEFLEENNVSYEKYLENKDAYDWAYKNPEKYEVVKQIDSLENYISYKDDIESIKEQYSTDNGYSTEQRKAVVQQYIESLSLDVPQKIMLEKMAGGYSIKDYENYMYGYIESLPMTAEEKQAIHNQLFN